MPEKLYGLVGLGLRYCGFALRNLWRGFRIIGLGGGCQQTLQVQQRRRVINGESTDIANPGREVWYHHRLAVGLGSKAALARSDPSEVAVRADFGDF